MGNPRVGFDEAGAGNGLLSTAPVLDPTSEVQDDLGMFHAVTQEVPISYSKSFTFYFIT